MKLLYVFIGFLNLFNLSYSRVIYIKPYICNSIYSNITPIICYNYNLLINNIITNNIPIDYYYIKNIPTNYIEDKPTEYIHISKKNNYSIYDIFIFCINKIIITLVNSLIIYIYIKSRDIKNKQLIINKVTIRINYNITFDVCSICYDNYTYYSNIRKIIKCNHNYHEKCIKEWIITYNKKDCPLCRCNIFD
jgi:hypothetical protein